MERGLELGHLSLRDGQAAFHSLESATLSEPDPDPRPSFPWVHIRPDVLWRCVGVCWRRKVGVGASEVQQHAKHNSVLWLGAGHL